MEISAPLHDEEAPASQELKAARAANSLADDNSDPLHELTADRRAKVSEAPPQLVTIPVSQLERLTARSSAYAEDPSCAEELESSRDIF